MMLVERGLRLEPLVLEGRSAETQLRVARQVLDFVYHDTLRLVGEENEAVARAVADPESDRCVEDQLVRMHRLTREGAKYDAVIVDQFDGSDLTPKTVGIVKAGLWRPGDEASYGRGKVCRGLGRLGQMMTRAERRPVGLHVFAVQRGLARAALAAVLSQRVPATAELVASVNTGNRELMDAFTAFGATEDGPLGEQTIRGYTATYQRFSLPPLDR